MINPQSFPTNTKTTTPTLPPLKETVNSDRHSLTPTTNPKATALPTTQDSQDLSKTRLCASAPTRTRRILSTSRTLPTSLLGKNFQSLPPSHQQFEIAPHQPASAHLGQKI